MLFHSCFALFSNILLHGKLPSHLWPDTRGGYGEVVGGGAQGEGRREHSTVTDLLPPIPRHIPSVRLSGGRTVHQDPGAPFIQGWILESQWAGREETGCLAALCSAVM